MYLEKPRVYHCFRPSKHGSEQTSTLAQHLEELIRSSRLLVCFLRRQSVLFPFALCFEQDGREAHAFSHFPLLPPVDGQVGGRLRFPLARPLVCRSPLAAARRLLCALVRALARVSCANFVRASGRPREIRAFNARKFVRFDAELPRSRFRSPLANESSPLSCFLAALDEDRRRPNSCWLSERCAQSFVLDAGVFGAVIRALRSVLISRLQAC